MKTKLQESLEKLVLSIHSLSKERWGIWIEKPHVELFFRWKLEDFEYGDTGIVKKSAKGEYITKPIWSGVAWEVLKKVSKLNIYNEVLKIISEGYALEEHQCNYYLERLITNVAWDMLAGKIKTLADSARYIDSFIKDLNGEKQEYRAEVQLIGLVLQPHSIQLDKNVRLRRPTRRDFEKEELAVFPSFARRPLQDPTVFLHTRVYATEAAIPLQSEIYKEIAVLRLFRVGAVQDLQYTMDTDSIIHIAGGTSSRGRLLGSDKYLITKEDVRSLKKFWANMRKIELPMVALIGEQKAPDELSIAYERYSDSLEGGIVEKRVSSGVMGLEALYLTEMDELPYRLSMRVGKLLSLITDDYKPSQVRDNVKVAYKIRNKYVHGGTLTVKDRSKFEKECGRDLNELLHTIMDYLRASIVALLPRKTSKTVIIQKIDDSFLDSEKEKEIKQSLFMPYQ